MDSKEGKKSKKPFDVNWYLRVMGKVHPWRRTIFKKYGGAQCKKTDQNILKNTAEKIEKK